MDGIMERLCAETARNKRGSKAGHKGGKWGALCCLVLA